MVAASDETIVVCISDLAANLHQYLVRAEKGQRYIVTRHGLPIAEIGPGWKVPVREVTTDSEGERT